MLERFGMVYHTVCNMGATGHIFKDKSTGKLYMTMGSCMLIHVAPRPSINKYMTDMI